MPNKKKLYEALKAEGYDNFADESSFNAYVDNADNRKKLFSALKQEGYDNFADETEFEKYLGYNNSEDDAAFEANAERFRSGQPIERVTTQSVIDANPELELGDQPYQYKPEVQKHILKNKPDMFKPKQSLMDAPLGINAPEGSDEKFQSRINVAQKNLQDPEYQKGRVKSEFRVLSDSVNADLEKIEDAITSRQKAVRNTDWKPGMPSSRDDAKLSELRGQRTYLEGAKELIEDSQNILNAVEAEKDGSFFGGLGRGIRDKAFDIDTWTMGLSDLVGGLRLKSVLEKAEKGENLTPAEQKLLDASVNNMAVNFYYRNDLGLGYQAGEITGQSIPFMLEFLVNPVSASGNAMAKRLLTYGLKRFGSAVNSKAIKAGTRLATDALAAGGVTATTGMGHVLSGGVERLNRNYEYGLDEEGNLNVVNTHNMGVGEAFAKSATSAFLERQSEMIFNAFRGAPSLFKGIETSLPGGVNTFMNYVRNSRLGELWRGIKNNATMNELAKRTQFHGLGEEYLEEVYNNFANIPLGEMTFEEATNLENNIVTFLGLAPTQVMFSAIGGIGYGVERYKAKRDLERTFGKMTEEQKRKLIELQEMGKLSTNKDIAFFLAETIKDESLTPEQKRAEIEYAYNLAKQNAIDEVSNTDVEDSIESENQQIDAATDPQTGMYGEVMLTSQDLDGNNIVTPANVFGEKEVNGELYLLVLPEGEAEKKWVRPNQYDANSYQKRPAEEVKALNEEMIREEAAQQAEQEAKYAPEVLNAQMPEGEFTMGGQLFVPSQVTSDGVVYDIFDLNEKGKPTTTIPIESRPVAIDEYRDMLQAQLNAEEAAQKQLEEQAAAPEVVEEVQPTEEVDVKENLTTESGDNLSPVEEVAQPQAEVQTPVIPTKEDGSIDFVSYGKEGTFKTLGEKYGEKMPNKVAVTAKALAEDLKKAQNKLQKAEEAYDNAPIGREQKAEEARDKAKQELEAIQREANFWAEMDAEIKDAQARRESMLNPQAEVETSTEPMNVDEFVAQQLASGNIVLDKEDYKKETGYGDTEANAMNGGATKLFGKNGMTIQEAGERLMEIDRENGTNFFDQLDSNSGRDALINVLGSVKSRKELNQYIASNRSEQAKKESEGLRNELEKQAMEANYASLEDYVLQMEAAEMEENPFRDIDVAQIDAIFVEAEEEYQNYINNEQGRTSEVVEGDNNVLPEEQADYTGGTSGVESEGNSERNGEGTSEASESTHAATEVELKQEEGETTLQFAERAAEENRRRPLRKRAEEWSNTLGIKVTYLESIDDVDADTRREIESAHAKGKSVPGWVNKKGEVFFFMPDLSDLKDVDDTYIHEVVAHVGLPQLLGKERFGELCDKVWEMMPQAAKDYYYNYPGVNSIDDSTKEGKIERQRRAADEYIAHLAEQQNLTPEEKTIWDNIVKAFRELLDKALNGIISKSKLTDDDIADIVKASYANLKNKAETAPVTSVTEAAAQEKPSISFNVRTEAELQEKIHKFASSNEGKETGWTAEQIESIIEETSALINALDATLRGNRFYDEFADREPTIRTDWRDGEAKPVVTWTRANIEYKYDMSADLLCINNDGMEAVLSSPKMAQLMKMLPTTPVKDASGKKYNFSLTSSDYLSLYAIMKDMGFVVPCKGCFDAAGRLKMLPFVAQKFAADVNSVVDERNKNPKKFDDELKKKAEKDKQKSVEGLPVTAKTKMDAIRSGVAGDNLTEHIDWTDLMTAEGQAKILAEHGGIFRAWQRTGAGRPKDKLPAEPYIGDITSSTTTIIGAYGDKTPSFRDIYVNEGTGLRRNSHSELRPYLAVDEIQFMRDAFIRNLTVFKYMKELDDVRLFGKMGVKFNMSFFPEYVKGTKAAGLDINGDYIASEESVGAREFPYQGEDGKMHYDGMKGWAEAQKYVNEDVSLSSVVFSIPHLIKALTDVPTPSNKAGIWGSLIPFHSSGATTAQLAAQGLGNARANGVGHGFEEALTDYGRGVTNFEAVQNDRFQEGWVILAGKKKGEAVEPGHKLEFVNGTHYYNENLGVHLFPQGYALDSEIPVEERSSINTKEGKAKYLHKFSVDYNEKVREIGTPTAYKDAADYYLDVLPKIGISPRFDFVVPENIFLQMCADVNVDPRHPKLGWKGEGNNWNPIDSEAYYSMFCDYGMTNPATGEWASHRPVGYVNENGKREFRLPENTQEIVEAGVNRYTQVRNREDKMSDDAIRAFADEMVSQGRLNQDQVDEVLGGTRFRFIGEQGAANLDKAEEATTRLDNLTVAREMEAAEKDAKAIKMATGWERGADGLWRYETEDVKLKGFDWINQKKALKLQDIVDDNELFTAYPILSEIKIKKGRGYSGGSYSNEKKELELKLGEIREDIKYFGKVTSYNEKYFKETVIHEIQHAIQDIEGFASGGSSSTIIDPQVWNEINRLTAEVDEIYAEWDRMPDSEKKITNPVAKRMNDEVGAKRKEIDRLFKDGAIGYEGYKKLSGEVEARNAATRMNMSEEERRLTLASETEDVAREDQIFLTNAIGVSEMGTTTENKVDEVASYFKGRSLNSEQQIVVDVYSEKKDNLPLKIKREDGSVRNIIMRQGVDISAGTKHSLFKHYGTRTGVISAEDILLIPEVIKKGYRKEKNDNIEYTLKIGKTKFIVYLQRKGQNEIFCDFYSSWRVKKNADESTSSIAQNGENTQSRARISDTSALSADKDTANSSDMQEGRTSFRVKSFETTNEELNKDGISINNKELMDKYGLSDITLSKSGNHVTLSKVVVEDKGKGNGTRFMEDLTNNADNNGWILALTPDTSFGGSSVARLKKFYKRFGFKDNKGRNTDFETRESMVRPVGGARFRISDYGKKVKAEVDKVSSKYNSKDVMFLDNEMTDEEVSAVVPGYTAADIKPYFDEGILGGYSDITDKIGIFANNNPVSDIEDTLFHENLHSLLKGRQSIVETFAEKALERFPKNVKELQDSNYEEKDIPEELLVRLTAKAMVYGIFDDVAYNLPEGEFENLKELLKEFGYEYEQEIKSRSLAEGRRGTPTLLEGEEIHETRRDGQDASGRQGEAGKGRKRKEQLGKLFDQVADMGLQGVLGNKEYTSLMVDIYKALPEEVRAEIAEDAIRLYGGSVAPAVSDYIGPKSKNSIMDKVVTIVREALRKVGFDLDLNANEVRYMAWRSKKPLDRNNMFEVAEDIDMKYRLKVGEYDGTTPDGGGTRFRVTFSVEEQAIIDKAKADGTYMKAPNGKPTNLTEKQWAQVRTKAFKKWFGDWENDAANASKVIDENGEPLVMYHGSVKQFTEFEKNKIGSMSGDKSGFYFTNKRVIAKDFYSKETGSAIENLKLMFHLTRKYNPSVYDVFLKSVNPYKHILSKGEDYGYREQIIKEAQSNGYDSVLFENVIDGPVMRQDVRIVFEPNQIKSATDNVGTFDEGNNDIRFRVANKLQVRDEYEASIKKGGYQAREAVQDAMLSLRKFQELIEKATGKKIRDFENAWMHENRLSSVVQAEIHDMERKFYKPMMDAVKKLMSVANLEQEQVADYLMLKHGIERNREMAVRKALTDDKGKIDRTRLEQWYQEKDAIRNDATLDTWRKKQEAMDNAALNYGADMSRDYSGLTSMFGTDDLADSTQKAYDEVEALETAHPVETESLGKAVKAMTQNTLDKSFESGLMDRKVYDELSKDMYDYYIPLRGFEETTSEEVYAYLDQDRGAFNAPLKRAKGRSSKSDNPIAYLKSIAESGIMQGNRNKMKQSFLNMVINHPSDLVSVREGVWVIYNPASGEWEAASAPAIPNNATPADVEAAMEAWEQQMEQAAQNDPNIKKVSEAADVPYRVVGNRMDQHQVIVKRLGKSYTLTINGNPRLAMAINGQTNPNNTSNDGKVAAFVNNKIGALNRSLAAWYTTRNPDFVASNFMRDTFYTNTIVRAKEGNAYANKFHKNYALVLPKMLGLFRKYENGTLNPADQTDAAFLDFMMNGGETGYSNLKDVEEIKKQITKALKESKWDKAVTAVGLKALRRENVEALAEKLDILNRAVENTARFAAYLTSREEGRSIAKSVFDAKEISVNFNKKGAGGTFFGMTGQTWFGNLAAMVGASGRALYVFFNAAIQGSTNLMHVMKVNPKGTSAGLAAMFLMGAVVPFLFGGDDEKDYYDLPEHVRRNHLIIPGTGDAWISIPLPIEYRIMYGMGELLTSWRTGHERGSDIARKMLGMSGQALPLNFLEEGLEAFVPSAVSPIYQVMTNSSWTGLPIYKENDFNKDDPEYTKAYSNVDRNLLKFTKALYEWSFDEENQKERIDLNPAIIETLAKGYFGGLATQLSNLAKVGGMIAGEQEFDWRNIPIGNRILKTGDERTKEKRVTNEYFENMEKLDFLQSRERMLKKTEKGVAVPEADKFKAQKDLETMQGTEVYKKYQEFKKQKKVVDKIRKTIKEKGSTPEREKQLMEAQEKANKSVR